MIEPTCTQCKSGNLVAGFISDFGQSAPGFSKWVEGALERGVFGGAKQLGRPKWEIDAYRCPSCGHLEMFAVRPD